MMENYIVISNCVVYNVAYDVSLDQEEVKENSNQDLLGLCKWFYENCMVQNPVKFHYIYLGKDVVSNSWQCHKEDLKASIRETGLGIEIYNKLNFEGHIKIFAAKHFKI